jgi:hypothetical protein
LPYTDILIGDVFLQRRFVTETFCYGDVLLQKMFCYGDILLWRCFEWRDVLSRRHFVQRRFVREPFFISQPHIGPWFRPKAVSHMALYLPRNSIIFELLAVSVGSMTPWKSVLKNQYHDMFPYPVNLVMTCEMVIAELLSLWWLIDETTGGKKPRILSL